jgi:transglutaminase-like putative cysteine protease
MSLPVIFQISLYCLTALTGVMLAFAEEVWWPAGVTLPVTIVAFVYVERQQRLLIPAVWANLLGVVIFCVAGYEATGESADARLVALSHLLTYLTWLVLFQQKTARQYWWLCALSMLQVAMGSLLTMSGWYGIFLYSYVIMAAWTLGVLMLHQGERRCAALTSGSDEPVARQTTSGSRVSRAFGAIRHEDGETWVTPRFVIGNLSLAIAALVFSTSLYAFVPVGWTSVSGDFARLADSPLRPLTGFTENVRLGDMGEILESTQPVMKVRLMTYRPGDDPDDQVDIVEYAAKWGCDEPMFRGMVLENYESGRWSPIEVKTRAWPMPRIPRTDMLRLEVIAQPIGTQTAFTIYPFRAGYLKTQEYEVLTLQPETEVLTVSRQVARQQFEYRTILWPDVPDSEAGRMVRLKRHPLQIEAAMFDRLAAHRVKCLQFPERGLERLRDLAQRVVAQAETSDGGSLDSLARARTLESYLRDSGLYTYTLNAAVNDPKIDPVEDFLFNRQTGHCEYYASALALMLRAVGIPSRMITGFKGGFYSSPGGYYEIQQRHAHSWVEAYVEGAWVTLDATPTADRQSLVERLGHRNLWQAANDIISNTWNTYVVNMTASRQDESIYGPLQAAIRSGLSSFSTSPAAAFFELFGRTRDAIASPQEWFSLQGGVAVFVILVCLAAAAAFIRRVLTLSGALRSCTGRRGRGGPRVEFLERFVKLMNARGLHSQDSDTPREFARTTQRQLAGELARANLADFPIDLTELYYRVRFGDEPLRTEEGITLDEKLVRLERSLNGK